MKKTVISLAAIAALLPLPASAHKDEALHFNHPLTAESPETDTKLRVDYIWQNAPGHHEDDGKVKTHTARLTGEYAFSRSAGIEVSVPYVWRSEESGPDDNHTGNIHAAVKFVSHSLASRGVLIGGGLEVGLPSGDEEKGIGSDHEMEVAPFLIGGYKTGRFQAVAAAELGFPVNEKDDNAANNEIGWNIALGWSATDDLNLLLEAGGEKVSGGEEDGHNGANLTAGLTWTPPGHKNLMIGAGVSFPVTEDKEFYVQPMVSLFYHFPVKR
ncbi:MAG: hypothetical protein HY370_03020 [Proteobacteria bacterium]|nr:hypothetical protein [Pseudomonadota bacterium]